MNLPIDLVPGTSPPRFRWKQTISTPIGSTVSDNEGTLPPSVEVAVADLIGLAKRQAKRLEGALLQIAEMQKVVDEQKLEILDLRGSDDRLSMGDRLAAQDTASTLKRGRGAK